MRWCPVCGDTMAPEFGSPCEDPIAWSCPTCSAFQLETGGRALTEEQAAIVREIARPGARAQRAPTAVATAPDRIAREIMAAFGIEPPVNVERVAALLGCPIEWVSRPIHERGGVAGQGGIRLVLNRDYPFRSEAERRWVIAEELGHAVLGHGTLAASDEPGRAAPPQEAGRGRQEREAHRFAAELLMPAAAVRTALGREASRIRRALGTRERDEALRAVVAELAQAFAVSHAAMRVRLEELGLIS